jgi:hypothetical protein
MLAIRNEHATIAGFSCSGCTRPATHSPAVSTGSDALSGHAPKLAPAVAAKAEFLAGLYVTLDYRPAKRFELSRHTVYQLFVRERGLRSEYVELLLSRDADDVAQVLEVTGGELLQTRLPKLIRFLILEEYGGGQVPDALREDCRVVTYDNFMGTFVDLDQHLADVAGAGGGQRREPADRGPARHREDDAAQATCDLFGGRWGAVGRQLNEQSPSDTMVTVRGWRCSGIGRVSRTGWHDVAPPIPSWGQDAQDLRGRCAGLRYRRVRTWRDSS